MSRKLLLAALLAATACGSESAKAPEDPIGPEAQPASDGAPPGQPDPGPDPASATEPTASGQEPESPPPAIEDEQLIDVPEEVVLPEDGDDADGDSPDPIGRVSISGPLDHSRFDEDGARLLRLVAEDSRTASEGLLELTGVRLELEGQGVVLAETGRVRFESTGGRLVLGGPEDRIELEVAAVPCAMEAWRIDGALRALSPLETVDPSPGRTTRVRLVLPETETGGIGIAFRTGEDAVSVRHVRPDSPAWEAGLRVGDRIVAVDGEPTGGLQQHDFIALGTGPVGSEVVLTVAAEDGTVDEIVLQRAALPN